MDQTKKRQNLFMKTFLRAVFFALFTFAAMFILLTYAFFQFPEYENYYSAFPFILLVLESLCIVFISRRLSKAPLLLTFAVASVISILSLILGAFFRFSVGVLPRLIAVHLVFISFSVVLQAIIFSKRPVKRSKKAFPFKK